MSVFIIILFPMILDYGWGKSAKTTVALKSWANHGQSEEIESMGECRAMVGCQAFAVGGVLFSVMNNLMMQKKQ